MSEPRLYLASASPRRRKLLAEAGIAFEPCLAPVDEEQLSADYAGSLGLLGEHLARHKARAAQQLVRESARDEDFMVLAADTTVLLEGESLAKPVSAEEAAAMLRQLRGREHLVATGVAVAGPAPAAIVSATATTRVLMRRYSDDDISAYIATGDPMDKAGAYSIQHPHFHPVAHIAGCHLGVIGLPLCIVATFLRGEPLPPTCGAPDAVSQVACCPWSGGCQSPLPGPEVIHTGQRLPGE
jgi:nucleoside triphosphate pyrophosphatase